MDSLVVELVVFRACPESKVVLEAGREQRKHQGPFEQGQTPTSSGINGGENENDQSRSPHEEYRHDGITGLITARTRTASHGTRENVKCTLGVRRTRRDRCRSSKSHTSVLLSAIRIRSGGTTETVMMYHCIW